MTDVTPAKAERNLIVYCDDSAAILCGVVREVRKLEGGKTVVRITNRLPMPASESDALGTADMIFDTALVDKVRPEEGSVVIAMTESDPAFGIFCEGGECGQRTFKLKGSSLRYSGILPAGNELAVAGTIVDRFQGGKGTCSLYKIRLRVGKEDVIRRVGFWRQEGMFDLRAKVVFITREFRPDRDGKEFAWASRCLVMPEGKRKK